MQRLLLAFLFACCPLSAFADGAPDPAFGNGGVALSGVSNAGGFVRGLAAQPDGKIVLCDRGNLTDTGGADFYVTRFDTNGSLDATFGSMGHAFVDFGGNPDYCNTVAVQPDGKLVLAGSTAGGFAVARLNGDGSPDTTFGTANGQVIVDFGNPASSGAFGLAIQPSGAIIVVGATGPDAGIAQLLPNGTLDPSFGVNGKIISHFALGGSNNVRAVAVALDSVGRIVVAATGAGSDGRSLFLLNRLLASGTSDMSFGVEGFATVYFTYGGSNAAAPTAVAIGEGDKVVVAGAADISPTTAAQNFQYAIARLNADGALDPTFGNQGQTVVAFSQPNTYLRGMGIQSNGLIVLAGQGPSASSTAVPTAARLNIDGSLDSNFGKQSYSVGAAAGFYSAIVAGTNLYAAGFYTLTSGHDDMLVKLTNDQVFGNGF